MQGGPPDTLSGRHVLMQLMVAAGWNNNKIGDAVGIHPTRVSTIKSSPLFMAGVAAMQRAMAEQTVLGVVERINAESGNTLSTMLELRDGAENESVRLGAARELFDRSHPKVQRIEEDRTVRIAFDAETLRRMTGAAREVGAGRVIDVSASKRRGAMLRDVPLGPPSGLIGLDDLIAELQAQAS